MGKVISSTEFDYTYGVSLENYLKCVDSFYDLIWEEDIHLSSDVVEVYRDIAVAFLAYDLGEEIELPTRVGAANYEAAAIQVALYFSAPERITELFESYTGIQISVGD